MTTIASYIDHTVLKQTTTAEDITKLCDEAVENFFYAVCVPPIYVEQALELLEDTDVRIATVIGFPMGYHSFDAKLVEADLAIEEGVDEIDVVMNISDLLNGELEFIESELIAIREICHAANVLIKVIIESGILSDEQIKTACQICAKAKVDFVKTSTGFAGVGATLEAVKLMRSVLPASIQIKASGGIKDYAMAMQFIEAGATRIGTSNGVDMVRGAQQQAGLN